MTNSPQRTVIAIMRILKFTSTQKKLYCKHFDKERHVSLDEPIKYCLGLQYPVIKRNRICMIFRERRLRFAV
jgi:hypothetical protein